MKKLALFFVFLGVVCSAWGKASYSTSDDEDLIVVTAGKIEQSINNAVEKIHVVSSESSVKGFLLSTDFEHFTSILEAAFYTGIRRQQIQIL